MYATTKDFKRIAFTIYSQNIEQAFGIQVTFITEIKPEKKRFLTKKIVFLVTFAFVPKPCLDGNVPAYATTIELKKIAFKINCQNIKENVGIQVTFILEIKPRLDVF